MAIERAIFGSLRKGIDGSDSGYQYYTYTPGYKAALEDDKGLENRLNSSYNPPKTDITYDWYYNETDHSTAARNEASDRILDEHPRAFSYWTKELSSGKKAFFSYGKEMGHDWTDNRTAATYHSAVICDVKDIRQAPVLYCSSPSVCCEIRRAEFFPEEGELAVPGPLAYIDDLTDENKGLMLHYRAGFDPIDSKDLLEFIREEGRVEILKSMVMAVMRNKDGDKKCHMVICDQSDHLLYWIAAISYLFPKNNVIDLSFCSYAYRPEIEFFDITGVFSPDLNGIAVNPEDKEYVSYYSFQEACSLSDAVYDFEKEYYAPKILFEENLFLRMVEQAFKLRRLNDVDAYKRFIDAETGFTGLGSDYIAGYTLFTYLRRNVEITQEQLVEAVSFAKKYADPSVIKELLERFYQTFQVWCEDSELLKLVGDFHAYCISKGIETEAAISQVYFSNLISFFLNAGSDQQNQYRSLATAVEAICNLNTADLLIRIGDALGWKRLVDLTLNLTEKWKLVHILSMTFAYANKGLITLEPGSNDYQVVYQIAMRVLGNDDVSRVTGLLDTVKNKIHQTPMFIRYVNAIYFALRDSGNSPAAQAACEQVINIYFSSAEQAQVVLQTLAQLGAEDIYLPAIIDAVGRVQNPLQTMDGLESLFDTTVVNISAFAPQMKKEAMKVVDTLSGTRSESTTQYYRIYDNLKMCQLKYHTSLEPEEIKLLLEKYLECLAKEYPDLLIHQDRIKELEELNQEYLDAYHKKETDEFVKVFFQVGEFKQYVDHPRESSRFSTRKASFTPVDYSLLNSVFREKYSASIGALCGQYWIENEQFFDFQDLLFSSDRKAETEMYDDFLFSLLQTILETDKVKGRGDKVAYIIEIGIVRQKQDKNDHFLEAAFKMLPGNIKAGEVIKALEKDTDELNKSQSSRNLKKQDKMLAGLEAFEILELVEEIKRAYAEESSKNGNPLKFVTGTLKTIFKKP